ncbi:hypothetical protein [Paractinoplanes maris]|uniref:hypothetical protein n=1 Tax=Paractinoplanes maris TaxID=1734446 RepID=UPI0020207916|nr:hypothetical protein [Actinoplanes maris]
MTAPGNEALIFLIALSILLSSAYAFGRIHQWHKRGVERDQAYRTGYDNASRSILSMMEAQQPAGAVEATGSSWHRRKHRSSRYRVDVD